MPSKNKAGGCDCCDAGTCCVTPIDMAATVSWAEFGDAEISISAGSGCGASGSGESDTNIPLTPRWGVNANVVGSYHYQFYAPVNLVTCTTGPPYFQPVDCIYLHDYPSGEDQYRTFLSEIVPISGSMALVVGSDKSGPPFYTSVDYVVYTEPGSGDCILRVRARVYAQNLRQINALPSSYDFSSISWRYLTGELDPKPLGPAWPNITGVPNPVYKYSDWHPCGEDAGLLPPTDCYVDPPTTGPLIGGEWHSGFEVTLNPRGYPEALGPNDAEGYALVTASDVDDDGVLPGAGEQTHSWIWELNLTDLGITDLADLANTTLDITNLKGTQDAYEPILGVYTPVASLPTDWEDETVEYYSPNSTTLASISGIEQSDGSESADDPTYQSKDAYSVVNGGGGGHVCFGGTPPVGDPQCTVSYLKSDRLTWRYRAAVYQSTFGKSLGSLSVLFKQASP